MKQPLLLGVRFAAQMVLHLMPHGGYFDTNTVFITRQTQYFLTNLVKSRHHPVIAANGTCANQRLVFPRPSFVHLVKFKRMGRYHHHTCLTRRTQAHINLIDTAIARLGGQIIHQFLCKAGGKLHTADGFFTERHRFFINVMNKHKIKI